MKSYTDIEQSKKLAKILPVESADMSWTNNKLKKEVSVNLSSTVEMQEYFDHSIYDWGRFYELIPCWSLAALIDVLPPRIHNMGKLELSRHYAHKDWYVAYNNAGIDYYIVNSNLIDACYEMILKLKENNIL